MRTEYYVMSAAVPIDTNIHLHIDMRRFGQQPTGLSVLLMMPVETGHALMPCESTHPLLFINKQNCHAVRFLILFVSSITTPLNSPLPLIVLMSGLLSFRSSSRKISPSRRDRFARSSFTRTSSAVIATAQPSRISTKTINTSSVIRGTV